MHIYLIIDGSDYSDCREEIVSAINDWLTESRSSAELINDSSDQDLLGLSIDTNRRLTFNKPLEFLPALLATFKLQQYFEFVAGGDSFSEKKPSPLPLQKALAFFQLTPAQCLMVGDSKNDILAAKAMDMASVCVTYGYNYLQDARELPASLHIDHFKDLVN